MFVDEVKEPVMQHKAGFHSRNSYESVRELLRRSVFYWFTKYRLVGGGGSMLIHIASDGLPQSRNPDLEAARLKTLSASERLQNYEELIQMLCGELRLPIYLFELSAMDIENFYKNAPLLGQSRRLSPQLRGCVLSEADFEVTERLVGWNPALRLYLDGGPDVESLWQDSLTRNKEEHVRARMEVLFQELQSNRHSEEFPVRIIYTESEIDLTPAIQEWNVPYLMSRETAQVIEYIKFTEP